MLVLTKFELTNIIGTRATQLSQGSPPTIDIKNLNNAYDIAMEEYKQGKIPIIIVRSFPDGTQVQINPNKTKSTK